MRVSGEFYIVFPGATQKSLEAADPDRANPHKAASAQGPDPGWCLTALPGQGPAGSRPDAAFHAFSPPGLQSLTTPGWAPKGGA